jgi:hypothetical protein
MAISPMRIPAGVSTAAKNTTLYNYIAEDPTKVHVSFDDFSSYTAGDWVVTETGSGSRALTAGNGGLLLITNAAADNDNNQFQRVKEHVLMSATKRAWFKTRLKMSDATQTDFAVGLMALDTDVFSSTGGDGVTDGIFFYKDDGVATLDFYVQKNTTTGQNTSAAVTTLADDTFVTLGWYFDANGTCQVFVNDVQIVTLDASATFLPDANLSMSFAIKNGEAVAKTMTVDYVFSAIER